ncbi:MAG: endonuclease/exonuclease/phosphatase family protein [Bacteroidia bacterium]|nr:endonuclease/exonuclease/phosphatase family protein [Bacteroidia bacterium]
MPFYNDLRPDTDDKKVEFGLIFPNFSNEEKKRTIENLLTLRSSLSISIPRKTADRSLLLASWNIKEFGHLKERLPESYFYIAEVISKFDLVAVQEVKSKLDDLFKVMKLLGSKWKYIITDITEGTDGNRERFAYIYDSRKVTPSGLSGEIVLWDKITEGSSIKQLKRTPAITGFKAGWKSFAIINVHLQPGKKDDQTKKRKEEIRLLLKALEEKKKKKHLWNENIIILGDMNLYKEDDDLVKLFDGAGFEESTSLHGKFTNVSNNEVYDRIFYTQNDFFQMVLNQQGEPVGNVLDVFNEVYTEAQRPAYHNIMLQHKDDPSNLTDDASFKKYYHSFWKRAQISDHNPIWLEIQIDSSDDFLNHKLKSFTGS